MSIDAGITCCPGKVFIFSVWDVLVRASISVFLCQSKVNNINKVSFLAEPHQKVIRLNVSVNEIL